MGIYDTNIKFLKKRYPQLVDSLSDLSDTLEDSIENTKNGEPNLTLSINGKGQYLHSKYSAKDESERWVKSISDKIAESKHLLIVGIGMGYFLEALLANVKDKDIFVYEPSSQIFNAWVNTRDVSEALSNSSIKMVGFGGEEYLPVVITNHIAEFLSGSVSIVVPPVYEKLFADTIKEIEIQMKERLINQISNIQTRYEYKETWLKNILNNINYFATTPTISDLKDIWSGSGVKAIVVGSGPSLRKDIHYLSELKEKCLIIAAGSSIQALHHFGISPHFIVSMDGSESNFNIFRNIDTTKAPLVIIPQVYSEITKNYKGDLFVAKFENDLIVNNVLDIEDAIPKFASTATVTGTAMQIAAFMGINEIILMGQDLSYPDEEYYAPGVDHITNDTKIQRVESAGQWVPNVEGGKNRTHSSMQVLLDDVEVLVKIMRLRDVKVINTSKKGAVIEGAEWVSMDEIAPKLLDSVNKDFNISEKIQAITDIEKANNLNITHRNLSNYLRHFGKVEQKLKKLDQLINSNLRRGILDNNFARVNNDLNEINKLWRWITNQDMFTVFYEYSLGHNINGYMRHVPGIVEANDPLKKGELIIQHLGFLVKQIIDFNPIIKSLIRESLEMNEKMNLELELKQKIEIT